MLQDAKNTKLISKVMNASTQYRKKNKCSTCSAQKADFGKAVIVR